MNVHSLMQQLSRSWAGSFLTFGFTPQGVQLVKVTMFDRPTAVAQCLFDKAETPLELAVGAAQGVFRVLLEVPGQVNGGKQQVADFILEGIGVVVGHGLQHFVEFLAHLVQHRQCRWPVETDGGCAFLQFGRPRQRRQCRWYVIEQRQLFRDAFLGALLGLDLLPA